MTTVDTSDPRLDAIRQNAAGKSLAQILTMRLEIARYERELSRHVAAENQAGATGELTRRFGSTGDVTQPQSAQQQRARVERHRAEIAYLDSLLSADPVLLAQAQAE